MIVIVSSVGSKILKFEKKTVWGVCKFSGCGNYIVNGTPADIRMRQTNNFRRWMLRNNKAVICV